MRLAMIGVVASLIAVSDPLPALAEGRDFQEQRWGAIAAAIWRDRNGIARAASGASWGQPSQNDAINSALTSCRNQGGQDCKIIGNPFSGCGYIAVGSANAAVRYGTGESPEAALDQCRKGGYRCNTPLGGCSN